MKVEDGRIAIGGKFIMPGPSRSQNVALSDKLLSVEVDQRPEPAASAAIQLLYDGVDAYVETQERRQITIELYDLSGRRLMILYRGSLDAGRTVLSVPDDLPTGSYLVRARDGEGGSSTMVIGR